MQRGIEEKRGIDTTMKAPERLETERLVLRRPASADAEAVLRYAGDPRVTRYVGWPTHRTLDDTRAFLAFSDAAWQRWPAGPYVIGVRPAETIVGGTGFTFDSPDCAMTGYVLEHGAWGNGYATEALREIVRVAPVLGIRRLYALCHVDHRPSAHVLEKCGFDLEEIRRRHAEFPNLAPGVAADTMCYVRVFACTR